ncbi:MAG: SRPBCC domain-containing protein [Actinobacteria bacterium]|nr:SRPBCC domain-containing protein [Actinomycetota bacterium]
MPTTRVSRTLAASPQVVWDVVADPWHQARWWPRVQRVEGARDGRFTQVMISARGRPVRADFRIVETVELRLLRWEQELAGTPFEGLLARAQTAIELAPADGGAATAATIELRQQLRGWSRLVPFLFGRAARRQLGEALEGLERAVAGDAADG